jgi:hypothetical protein
MVGSAEALNYSISSYYSGASASSRIGVPVSKNDAIYAQFEHVFAVPSEQGISLNRVMILEGLIDRLSSSHGESARPKQAAQNYAGFAPEKLDALIVDYQSQLKSKAAAASVPAYRPQVELPPAYAFSFFA